MSSQLGMGTTISVAVKDVAGIIVHVAAKRHTFEPFKTLFPLWHHDVVGIRLEIESSK